jgi:hypothetical protein
MTYGAEFQAFERRMQQPLIQLQEMVSNLDYDGIHRFFREYLPKDISFSSNCMMLVQMITRQPEFFSGKVQGNLMNQTKAFDNIDAELDEDFFLELSGLRTRTDISPAFSALSEEEKTNRCLRYLYVLNHLSVQAQINLLHDVVVYAQHANIDYFKVTEAHFARLSDEHRQRSLKDSGWSRIICHLFLTEQFDFINQLQGEFDFNFLANKQDFMFVYYNNNNTSSKSRTHEVIQISPHYFQPYFYVAVEYSEEKEQYLYNKTIALPNMEQIGWMKKILQPCYYGMDNVEEQKKLWLHNLAHYEKRIQYYHLHDQIDTLHGKACESTPKIKI